MLDEQPVSAAKVVLDARDQGAAEAQASGDRVLGEEFSMSVHPRNAYLDLGWDARFSSSLHPYNHARETRAESVTRRLFVAIRVTKVTTVRKEGRNAAKDSAQPGGVRTLALCCVDSVCTHMYTHCVCK